MATTKEAIKARVIPTLEDDVERISEGIKKLKKAVDSSSTTSNDIDRILRNISGFSFSIKNTVKPWISE